MSDRSLRRFFVKKIDPDAGMCKVSGPEARHIHKVLRMAEGRSLLLVDEDGRKALGRIVSVNPQEVSVLLEEVFPSAPAPLIEVVLCQAVLKSQRMDWVIQKTTELGVCRIVPFFSERTVVDPTGAKSANKVRRWREIARMATTQSGGDRPPEIDPPHSFADLLARYRDETALKGILWEKMGGRRNLKAFLRSAAPPARFIGMVGPEGGFSGREAEEAVACGFVPLGIGSRILRAETAGMLLVGIVQVEWGDLGDEADSQVDEAGRDGKNPCRGRPDA